MFGKKAKQNGPQDELAQLSLQGRGRSLFAAEVNPPPPAIDFGFEQFYSQAAALPQAPSHSESPPVEYMPDGSAPASDINPQWDQSATEYVPETAYALPTQEPVQDEAATSAFTFEQMEPEGFQELNEFSIPAPGIEHFEVTPQEAQPPVTQVPETHLSEPQPWDAPDQEPISSLDYPDPVGEAIPLSPPSSDLWSQLSSSASDISGSGLQMPITDEAPGQFLDTVNQQLYPESALDPMAFEASAQAFEEAADLLFPETISGTPMLDDTMSGGNGSVSGWSADFESADSGGLSLGPSFQAEEQTELHELNPASEHGGAAFVPDPMLGPTVMEPPSQGVDEMFLPETYFTPPDVGAVVEDVASTAFLQEAGDEQAPPPEDSFTSIQPFEPLSFEALADDLPQPGEETGWQTPDTSPDDLSDLQWDQAASDEAVTPENPWDILSPSPEEGGGFQDEEAPVYSLDEGSLDVSQSADSSFSWDDLQPQPQPELIPEPSDLNSPEMANSGAASVQGPVPVQESDPSQWSVENLQVLGVCPLDVSKNLLVVQHEQTTALMAQTGDPANPQVYVIKLFQENPLHQDPELVACREAKLGTKELYRVKIGAWQAIVSTDNEMVALHTELS